MIGVLVALTLLGNGDTMRYRVPALPEDTTRVIIVSERVGAEIDTVERRRFHLFPRIQGFRSAVFMRSRDSDCFVEITTARIGRRDRERYPVTASRIRKIGYFIDHFDSIIPRIAALADTGQAVRELWQGIGPDVGADSHPRFYSLSAPGGVHWRSLAVPSHASIEHQMMDGATGAALGLGIGSGIGAIAGIRFLRSRADSVWVGSCSQPGGYWRFFTVDEYELDRGLYAVISASGALLGGSQGYLWGQRRDQNDYRRLVLHKGLAGYDNFGEPILESEVRRRMATGNRTIGAFLGGASGSVAGAGLGWLVATLARSIVFRNSLSDTIEIHNDGFSFDIPLLTLWIGGMVRGAYEGYKRGEQTDREQALERIRRERLAAPAK